MQHELIDEVIGKLRNIADCGAASRNVSTAEFADYVEQLCLYRQQAEAARLNLIEATKREANGFRNSTQPDPTTAAIHAMRDICLALAGRQPRPESSGESRSETLRELQRRHQAATEAASPLTCLRMVESVIKEMRDPRYGVHGDEPIVLTTAADAAKVRYWADRLEAALK